MSRIPILVRLVALKNIHPILTHTVNGLTPTSLSFLIISKLYSIKCLEMSSFYLILAVTTATPLTMVSGLIDWKYKYGMRKFPLMKRKITTSIVGYIFVIAYVVFKELNHSIVLLILAVILFGITGELGGRLVHGVANRELLKKYLKD
ncbi:hypothetical protein DRP05_00610 [Archaeoglobales archaeon]|nr:MAG: hypothetical protein DRP05_00610 [Archaeoglobales archaeon]